MKVARVNLDALKKFQAQMKTSLTAEGRAKFTEAALKDLAARLLAKAQKRTPVGVYPAGSGKVGGTLRRAWRVGAVTKSGGTFTVEILNPVEYAPYVEFGHRTRDGAGWVEGQFMLTVSESELQADAPGILAKRLDEYLKGAFGRA